MKRGTEGSAFIPGLAGGSVAGADGIAPRSSHAVGASAVWLTTGALPPSSAPPPSGASAITLSFLLAGLSSFL